MTAKLFLLRHGAIENPGQGLVGQHDIALSRHGLDQARHWARVLAKVAFERIVASDLGRALTTAVIIAAGGPVESVPALREISLGAWEGLTREQIQARYPDLWQARRRDLANCRPPGGESFADLSRRVLPAFEAIAGPAAGPVLVVAHAGVIRVVLCHLLGMPLSHVFRLGLDYGALTLIDPAGPVLQAINLSAQMAAPRLPAINPEA
jgi:probable phosphoglycerate mutase